MRNLSNAATCRVPRVLLAIVAATLTLAACNGGSDSESSDASAATLPPPTQAADPPPTDAVSSDENAGYRSPSSDSADASPGEGGISPVDLFVQIHTDRIRVGTTVGVSVRGDTPDDEHALANAAAGEQPATIEFSLAEIEPLVLPLEKIERPATGLPTTWETAVDFPQPGEWQATIIRTDGSRTPGRLVLVEPSSTLLRPFQPRDPRLTQIAVFASDGTAARVLTDADSASIGWLSNPDRIVFINRSEDDLWVITIDPQTGAFDKLMPLDGNSGRIHASPDGVRFLVHDQRHGSETDEMSAVKLFDAANRTITTIHETPGTPSLNIAWAPDSHRFIVLSDRLELYDATGALIAGPSVVPPFTRGIEWAADSSLALIGPTGDGQIFRLNLANGTLTPLLATDDVDSQNGFFGAIVAAISPDSGQVALTWKDRQTETWRLTVTPADAGRDEILAAPSHTDLSFAGEDFPRTWLFALGWSPDTQQIAFTTIEPAADLAIGTTWLLDVADGTIRSLERSAIAPPPSRPTPIWSADGSQLLTAHSGCIYACDGGSWGATIFDTTTGSILREQQGLFNAAIDDGALRFLRSPEGLFAAFDLNNPILTIPGMSYAVVPSPGGEFAAAVISQSSATTVRYAVHPDGTGHEVLDVVSPEKSSATSPENLASPDGNREAVLQPDGLYVRDLDGELLKISDVSVEPETVHWSPDGSLIAFLAAESDHRGDVIVANTDGSGAHKLLDATFAAQLLGWDSDGRILYALVPMGA